MAACVCAAVGVAGCSGASTADHGRAVLGGGIVPRDSALVASFNVDPGSSGAWVRAREVLRRVPAFTLAEDRIPKPQTLVDQVLVLDDAAHHELDWQRDVRPWIGHHAGIAAWSDRSNLAGIAWVETSDGNQALRAMRRVYGPGPERDHAGATMYHGRGNAWWAVVDGRLVVATAQRALEHSLDAARHRSIVDDSGFTTASRLASGRDPLAQVVLTPHLWDYANAAVAKQGAALPAAQLASARQMLAQAGHDVGYASLAAGVDGTGVWLDATTIADRGGGGANHVDALHALLAQEPATSLAAVAVQPDARRDLSGANTLRLLLRGAPSLLLGTRATASARPAQDTIAALVGAVTNPGVVRLASGAWGGNPSLAVVERAGQLSVVARAHVRDAARARQAVDQVARSLRTLGVTALAPASGVQRYRIPGVHGAKFVSSIPGLHLDPRAVARSPLGIELAQTSFVAAVQTTPTEQLFAVPDWGLAAVHAAAGGTSQLGGNGRFTRDIGATRPPADATLLGWVDLQGLGKVLLDRVDPQVAFVADGQLAHVGGPVFWTTHTPRGAGTVTHLTIELPVYP